MKMEYSLDSIENMLMISKGFKNFVPSRNRGEVTFVSFSGKHSNCKICNYVLVYLLVLFIVKKRG